MNKNAVARELVMVARILVSGKRLDKEEAIAQALANAKSSGKTWYVNSVTDGLRVEKTPIQTGWAGARTLAEVRPNGHIVSK